MPAAQCEAGSLTHSSSLDGEAKGGLTPAQGALIMMLRHCVEFRSDKSVLGMGMRLSIRPSRPAYRKPRFDRHRKEREREESVGSLTWGGQECHFLEGNAH